MCDKTVIKTSKNIEIMTIDTSKMSKGQAEALEIAEAGRDAVTEKSLAAGLFVGEFNTANVHPWPEQTLDAILEGETYIRKLENLLIDFVDADEIDKTGEIPQEVFDQLAKEKAFAVKIPKEYGGLGLSQYYYSKAAQHTGKVCGNIAALLSAHQSIGVPQPLLMYGTKQQKEKYLPRFSRGEVSAFALTENGVGSDPAQLKTVADPIEDGDYYIINGEKLWCTNGVKASTIVVMVRTPDKDGKKQITACIVDMDTPGVEVVRRCHFMGLRALYNGIIRFKDVKIPKENIILGLGKGMRVALNTLNIGRLTIPALCVGASKECLRISRRWTSTRSQWGQEIGRHQLIADKLARMASETFAMEAMVQLCSSIVDKKNADIRVESAMAKMWATETYWKIVDDTMQMKGGRGYETVESLESRGEDGDGVERMFRDARINLIFEGSSEIMRLILAREALDPHLKAAGKVLNTRVKPWDRVKAAFKAGLHYAVWYPKQWLPVFTCGIEGLNPKLRKHMRYVRRASKKLARTFFHRMVRFGPKLERQQLLLSRLTEIGTELFVITAAVLKANKVLMVEPQRNEVIEVVECLVRNTKCKIDEKFRGVANNNDQKNHSSGKKILKREYKFLETI